MKRQNQKYREKSITRKSKSDTSTIITKTNPSINLLFIIFGLVLVTVIVYVIYQAISISKQDYSNKIQNKTCSDLEQEIRTEIESANYCKKYSDCVSTPLRCPLKCSAVINKLHLNDINRKLELYSDCISKSKNSIKCQMECSIEHSEVKCLNNKCYDVQFSPIMLTDKTEYIFNETIGVFIYNSLEDTLKAPVTLINEGLSYEEKINDNWETSKHIIWSPNGFIDCLESISPEDTCEFELSAPQYAGIYRIRSQLWTESGERIIVYSDEFEIIGPINISDNYCEKDEDCVFSIYEENVCCSVCPNEVITEYQENIRRQWQRENCQREIICPDISCMEERSKAVCLNHQC